jgi:large subunit ribosomal protein L10
LPTQKKVETVAELTELINRSSVVIGSEYRGLSVSEVTNLRKQLREQGLEMHVIKNTLFSRAAVAAGKAELAELCEGPTAIVVGFSDPIAPIKTVVEYQRTARNSFAARKAYLDGTIYTANRLSELATLPPRETLLAEVAGALASPITTFVYLLQATMQEFAGLLDARAQQMEGAA